MGLLSAKECDLGNGVQPRPFQDASVQIMAVQMYCSAMHPFVRTSVLKLSSMTPGQVASLAGSSAAVAASSAAAAALKPAATAGSGTGDAVGRIKFLLASHPVILFMKVGPGV